MRPGERWRRRSTPVHLIGAGTSQRRLVDHLLKTLARLPAQGAHTVDRGEHRVGVDAALSIHYHAWLKAEERTQLGDDLLERHETVPADVVRPWLCA